MSTRDYIVSKVLSASVWIRYGYRYRSPLKPDKIVKIDSKSVENKLENKPPTDRIPPTAVVGGSWDCDLEPLAEDIVYKAFHKRFVEGKPWDETGYVEFLATDISEHGERSRDEAKERCEKIDQLYNYIKTNGYKSQQQLQKEGELIQGLGGSIRPPTYREVAVNVTRDGEFVWHAGMHRLVIAQLLEVDEIPVRIHVRHAQWQEIRERAYRGQSVEGVDDNPDINWLM